MSSMSLIQALQSLVAKLERTFGRGLVSSAETLRATPPVPLALGHEAVDALLGGGLGPGVHELLGGPAVGKTTLACAWLAAAQRQGVLTAYLDVERGLQPGTWEMVGVDPRQLLLARPESAEQALALAGALIDQGVGLVVLDTVAALLPTAEREQPLDKDPGPLLPRLLARGLRQLAPQCADAGARLLLVNQTRERGEDAETSGPGGSAVASHAHTRLVMTRTGWIGEAERPEGACLELRVLKRRGATPGGRAALAMRYGRGFEPA
ncbi:MAG: hypothetical protein RIT45_134 [Pseudomonadota bacterium]